MKGDLWTRSPKSTPCSKRVATGRLTFASPIVNPLDPKELLMVLAPSVGSSKGHYKGYEIFES